MVIDAQFDDVGSFRDGLAFVEVLGKEAYIIKTGAFVVDPFPGTTVRAEKARLAADRPRVEQGIIGAWEVHDPPASSILVISRNSGVIDAVTHLEGDRYVYRGELLSNNKLRLTFSSTTSKFDSFKPAPFDLELSADGESLKGQSGTEYTRYRGRM